jgi:hypothetical protein
MTRHRDEATLYYGENEIDGDVIETLARDRPKDISLDYLNQPPSLAQVREPLDSRRERGLERD